jgi:molybdopterin-guanine dinucleotide biosynthesis protein MobB
MKVVGLIGVSALGRSTFVDDLIEAFRLDDWTVSTIKRAPDGFDLDQPGKTSYARREAGCREVMLVGDKRLVLMNEFRDEPEPTLESLVVRLAQVDVVIAEGFQSAAIPTVEVCVPASGREYRWKKNPNVFALVSNEAIETPLPRFTVDDVAALAEHVAKVLELPRCDDASTHSSRLPHPRKDLAMSSHSDIKEVVREKYGQAALRVKAGQASCCGSATSASSCCDPITSNLYEPGEAREVPDAALKASLGCGNPTALAELKPGETVLDLGSGGGIDVLLSARRVGPTGKAFGLDMTDEMLALAEENKRKSGLTNVHFLKGEIENIPLPDNSVDVIISNCVINLSGDKDRVLKEAFRVLRPGGRFAVSDVVVRGEVPAAIRKSMELWVGCIAGALSDTDYTTKLAKAGFGEIGIEVTRVYGAEDAREFLTAEGLGGDAIAREVDGKFVSAFVQAVKPVSCCTPSCCSQ